MTTALLVIDVQRAITSGRFAAHDSEGVIARINAVAARARDAGVPVVVIQHEDDGPLRYGSDAWQLDPRLTTSPADVSLRKRATDSFHATPLQAELASRGVTELVVCGFQSDFCVDTTTRRALALGYPVRLISDGHATVDNEVLGAAQISAHHNVTLAGIESFGVRASLVAARDVRFEDVTVRPFEPRDRDRVIDGWHASNRASYPYVAEIQRHTFDDDRRFFDERIVPGCRIFVAETRGEVAGMLALEAPWIRHFAVFEGYRSRGIGSRLLEAARLHAPDELRLFTFQRNAGARRFYERHGFHVVALGVSPAPELEPDVEYAWRRSD